MKDTVTVLHMNSYSKAEYKPISPSEKLVYNGRFSNFYWSLFMANTMDYSSILQDITIVTMLYHITHFFSHLRL